MCRMTGQGLELRTYAGNKVIVDTADRVRLFNGMEGVVHCWTNRGVMVRLEDSTRFVDGLRVLAVDVGDGEVEEVLPRHAPVEAAG